MASIGVHPLPAATLPPERVARWVRPLGVWTPAPHPELIAGRSITGLPVRGWPDRARPARWTSAASPGCKRDGGAGKHGGSTNPSVRQPS